jgi:hypothetical protein
MRKLSSQARWFMPVVFTLERLNHEDHELKASLGYKISFRTAGLHSETLFQNKIIKENLLISQNY